MTEYHLDPEPETQLEQQEPEVQPEPEPIDKDNPRYIPDKPKDLSEQHKLEVLEYYEELNNKGRTKEVEKVLNY